MESSFTFEKATEDYVPEVLRKELLIPATYGPGAYYLGPMGNADPADFINQETQQIPFKASKMDSNAWGKTFRNWPYIPNGWRNWYRRVSFKKAGHWDTNQLHQCITLSLSEMERNDSMLIAASYFWCNSANAFVFGYGPMAPTLADIFMLTGLRITGSVNPYDFMSAGSRKLGKITDSSTWPKYIANYARDTTAVEEKEHIAFLNMWLEKFLFCGSTIGPNFNNKYLAECLIADNEIQMGKLLLGSLYNLMNKVSAKILLGEAIGTITGPWWLLQMWLNLYMFKFARPNLRNLYFPSSNYAEEDEEPEQKYRGCQNYGEAASAIVINFNKAQFFKVLYKGFENEQLVWLPYDQDDENDLIYPMEFRFSEGCTEEASSLIFNCFIRPCALPVDFRHGRNKSSNHPDYLPTYEFYNPSFVARQFGLGQLPPTLYFSNILKPREGISSIIESNKIFQLGSELPSYAPSDWRRATFSSSLYDAWWEEWHAHIFCSSVHIFCQSLDENHYSKGEEPCFNPPAIDRNGNAIKYYTPCPKARMGSGAPSLKMFMRKPASPVILIGTKRKTTDSCAGKTSTSKGKKSKPTTGDESSSAMHGLSMEEPNISGGNPVIEEDEEIEASEDTHGRNDWDRDEHPQSEKIEANSQYVQSGAKSTEGHSADYSLVHLYDEEIKVSEPTEHITGRDVSKLAGSSNYSLDKSVHEISSDNEEGSRSVAKSSDGGGEHYHEGIEAQSQYVIAGLSPPANLMEGGQLPVNPTVEHMNATDLSHISSGKDGSKSPSLSYSFDYTKFIDEGEVSSLLSVEGGSAEDVQNRLKDVLPFLGNISDIVENVQFIRTTIMDIQVSLPQNLLSPMMRVAEIEDQIPRIKRAQKNMPQKSSLVEKKIMNKQKAHELHASLKNLESTSSKLQPELDNLYARKSELEKELQEVNDAISSKQSMFAPICTSMEEKKKEMRSTISEGVQICKELKTISALSSEDEILMAQIENVRSTAIDAINNFLSE